MIERVKKELIENTDNLISVLDRFGFCNIAVHSNYITFGRDEVSSRKSIVIRTEDNKRLYVNDYARNFTGDIFQLAYIEKGIEFKDALQTIKEVLGIADYSSYFTPEKREIFGGIYSRIKRKSKEVQCKTYDLSELSNIKRMANTRFQADNIDIVTQLEFGIGYNIEDNLITIPILSPVGECIALKARVNREIADGEQKYFYLLKGQMSQTLYGYYQNYNNMYGSTVYVFEAEKSVQQCASFGVRNCVALGSSSLSAKQAKLIMGLHPKRVVFLHDNGLPIEAIKSNIATLERYMLFSEANVGYWNWKKSDVIIGAKDSPSDNGIDIFNEIVSEVIYTKGDITGEEEIQCCG